MINYDNISKEKILNLIRPGDVIKLSNFIDILELEKDNLNLISSNSFKDIWGRHVLDSVQLNKHIKNIIKNDYKSCIIDLGSGNGFPIIPIILTLENKSIDYFLCEKSSKKCTFLKKAIHRLQLDKNNKIKILNFSLSSYNLIELVRKNGYNNIIFTSRAFKSIKDTLDILKINQQDKIINKINIIFLKGKKLDDELQEAKKFYQFNVKIENSQTTEGYVAIMNLAVH